jgi:hypothetical protein
MEKDSVDCGFDLSNKGETLRDSSLPLGNCPANIRSWGAFENSLSPHTALSDTSQDRGKKSRSLTEQTSFCGRTVNVVCPHDKISLIPDIFISAPEALSPLKSQAEGSTSNLAMVQLTHSSDGVFKCSDVTTCLHTITTVLRKASDAVVLFVLSIFYLMRRIGEKPSWVSDLRTVVEYSWINCRLDPVSPFQRLKVILTNQEGFPDTSSIFSARVRQSLRDELGLVVFDQDLWTWTRESKLVPLTKYQQHDLLHEILKGSTDRQLADCKLLELENMLLEKKRSRTEMDYYQDVVAFARRRDANVQTILDHLQKIGLVLYFPPPDMDDLPKEAQQSANYPTDNRFNALSVACDGPGVLQTSEHAYDSHPSTFFVLHLSTFSSYVKMLSDFCSSLDMEINYSLIPVARHHGILPKRHILEELHNFPSGFNHAAHWSGILIDPAWCQCNSVGSVGANVLLSGLKDTDHYEYYLFPAALQSNKLFQLTNHVTISPLAYKQPGVTRVDIPLIVFYHLIGHLMKHFSKIVFCGKHTFRFLASPPHLVDIHHKGYYIQIDVHVQGLKFDPAVTARFCKTVRERITTCLNAVVQTCNYHGLSLEPSILLSEDIGSPSAHIDFVTFSDNVLPSNFNMLTSSGGLEVKLPDDIIYWYGKSDQVQSQIRSNFCHYSEIIDACKTAAWLYESLTFTRLEYDSVIYSDSASRSGKLLRLLESKEKNSPDIMTTILKQRHLLKHVATESTQSRTGHVKSLNERPQEVDDKNMQDPAVSQSNPTVGTFEAHQRTTAHSSTNRLDLQTSIDQDKTGSNSRHGVRSPTSVTERPSSVVARGRLGIEQGSSIETSSVEPERFSDRPPVAVTSPATKPYEEIQRQVVFPRRQAPAGVYQEESQGNVAVFHRATETIEPTVLRTQVKDEEPQIQPVYESKYWHVQRATDNFNEKPLSEGGKRLGVGSFGTVFYGILHSESGLKYDVAVKRLKKASSLNPAQVELSRKQFGVELNLLTRYIHPNIVRLVAFSSDGPELCLVYEYMENGALSHRLDCKDKTTPLGWRVRIKIGLDIAVALDFLHNRYRLPVIHRDVKSANVLLGKEFEAKLSDFGLAVVGDPAEEKMAERHGRSAGTKPYMAPEATEGVIIPAIDVYSLGMVVILFDCQ